MQYSQVGTYFSGLSSLQLPIPKFLYPPPFENASRLTYYSSLFNSIEINSSFYKIPQAVTVFKWTAIVSENFKFTFKLLKEITHSKGLNFNKDKFADFLKSISSVKEKIVCLLIQFTSSLVVINIVQLSNLLNYINEIDTIPTYKIAVELRNKSWYHNSVSDLLNYYNTAAVIHDKQKL